LAWAAQYLYQDKSRATTTNTARTTTEDDETRTRRQKENRELRIVWQRLLLMLCFSINITYALSSLQVWHIITSSAPIVIAAILPALGGLAALFIVPLAWSRKHPAPSAAHTEERAEPANWHGGLFYANRADHDLIVPKGEMGATINFSHPRAKWLIIAFCSVIAPVFIAVILIAIFAHH
jgi:uncharacterized membrane protein